MQVVKPASYLGFMTIIKLLGLLITVAGMVLLIFGVVELFDGHLAGSNWAFTLLGLVFFFGGLGLLRSAARSK